RDLSLDVQPGEIVGIVGESGAGKAPLAGAIMGLLARPGRIDSGSIRFDGRDMLALDEESLRAVRGKDIAMVIPNPRGELDPLIPVGRQISRIARAHLDISRGESDRLALGMLRAVQIPDPKRRFHAYPHELSRGMAPRVVLGIALGWCPEL